MRNLQPLPEATDDAGRQQNRLTGMYRQVFRKDPSAGTRYVFAPATGPAVEHRYIDGRWQPVTR